VSAFFVTKYGDGRDKITAPSASRSSGNRRVTHMAKSRVAPEHSIRIKAFYRVLPYVQDITRRGRMEALLNILEIKPGTRILDLGGSPTIWGHVSIPLDITIVNLSKGIPAFQLEEDSVHTFHYVEGDACNVQLPDHSFDLVFSNSVIEHVGSSERQEKFAREVTRLGNSYWVQTPSAWFPIEAHTGMPFYWFYPEWFRSLLFRRWQKKLPTWWTDLILEIGVLSRKRMAELFPDARIRVEFLFGLTKSYIAYSAKDHAPANPTAADRDVAIRSSR